ncbi:hypothetical protein Tco_1040520 [Tanacetum coccineum]
MDVACEEYAQEVLGFSDNSTSGNPSLSLDPILSSFHSLSPFEGSDSIFENRCGDILLLVKLLNDDPSSPLPPNSFFMLGHLKSLILILLFLRGALSSKDFTFYREYAFLEGTDKLPVIIAKNLKEDEEVQLLKVLSLWASPVHYVPKKGGITIIENDDNELIPTRLVTGWRVCIDYRKLNDATRKDHFSLPFMDQMLERLAGNEYYCFLDGFSGYLKPKVRESRYYSLWGVKSLVT